MKRGMALLAVGVAWLCLARAPLAAPPVVAAGAADETFGDFERRMHELEKRLDSLRADARARLETQRRLLERRLDEMRTRSTAAWQRLRPELERALDELRRTLEGDRPEPGLTRT